MRSSVLTAGLLLACLCAHALAQIPSCTHTVGMVVPLTGPAGRFGQAAAQAVELAFQELNKAAGAQGIAGCELVLDLRDDEGEGSVGVDQARQLVDLRRVPVIIGSIISSVTVPHGDIGDGPFRNNPDLACVFNTGAHKIGHARKNTKLVFSHHHI